MSAFSPSAASAEELLETLFTVSLTGLMFLRPLYEADAAGGSPSDWRYERLNPVARHLLGLPEHPHETLLAGLPRPQDKSLALFYCDAFLAEEARHYHGRYQHTTTGAARYLHLAAQRQGERLVASVTTTGPDHPTVGVTPVESPAQVPLTYNKTKRERSLLQAVLRQAPMAIALFQGPEQVVVQANELICAMWGHLPEQVIGRPLLDGVPELRGQGFTELMQEVARTGVPFVGTETPAQLLQNGRLETHYFNFVYQPLYGLKNEFLGVLDIATDVTTQVVARQQVQRLNEELATVNEELRAMNEALISNNAELTHVQQQLQQLNQELERRVAERTLALEQSKAEVERSAQQFQLLTDTIEQLVWTATAEGAVDYYSPQWYRYTGNSPADSPGQGWATFVHPDDLVAVYQNWQHAVAHGTPYQAEARLQSAGGEYRWFLARALPLRDAAGQVSRWFGTNTDVHEQKSHQQRLLESEQYFRLMADNVPAMLWVTESDGQCTYLNRQWYAYTGQQEANALGAGWLEAVHAEDAAATWATFQAANGRQAAFSLLYRLRHHDGHYRWAMDSGLPYFRATGEFAGFVGTVVDVHEQKLAEQALQRLTQKLRLARDKAQGLNAELRHTNRQLVRTNVDLDNFIYTASHDLKAPITNIEGLLQLMREQLPAVAPNGVGAEVAPLLRMMQDAVDRFTRTIDNLSDVTKLQKEQPDQAAPPVAVAPVLDDVLSDLQQQIQHTGAQVEVDLTTCPTVTFSVKNLRSVLYNLVSNALKYQHPDRAPHVRIHCRPQAEYAVLTVQDNGLGLTPDQQAELFTMFRRLHNHVQGSGIGLYMVKRSVENAGGRVEVVSELGVGSTFLVYFRQ